MQDALSEVMKVYARMKLKIFVGDMRVFMQGQNKELPGSAEKVLESIKS